jgi:DNA-binding transcriptional regulator YhcF (GntR family)
VNKAYAMLSAEGYIVMDRRKGAVVADIPADAKQLPKVITDKLDLLAAEAICRGMDYMNFVSQCMQAFRRAKGE